MFKNNGLLKNNNGIFFIEHNEIGDTMHIIHDSFYLNSSYI